MIMVWAHLGRVSLRCYLFVQDAAVDTRNNLQMAMPQTKEKALGEHCS